MICFLILLNLLKLFKDNLASSLNLFYIKYIIVIMDNYTPLEEGSFLTKLYYDSFFNYNIDFIFEPTAQEIEIKLFKIINSFNDHLDKININNDYVIIGNFLLFFLEKKIKRPSTNLIDYILNTYIIDHIISIINYYNQIDKKIISSNSIIKYYFVYSIYKSIIILYSYYIYLTSIEKYIDVKYNKPKDEYTEDEINEMIDIEAFFNDFNYINSINGTTSKDNEDSEDDKNLKTLINELYEQNSILKKLNEEFKTKKKTNFDEKLTDNFKIIIKKFNKSILGIDDAEKLSHQDINNKSEYIKAYLEKNKKNDNEKNTYKYKISELIIQNFTILQTTTQQDNYITIPQYVGICWFISILTGMCYSDGSKKLILSKIEQIEKIVKNIETTNYHKRFINIVLQILNITIPFQKYTDANIENYCEYFLFFKNNLETFLLEKLHNVKETLVNNNISKINIKDYYFDDDFYFINLLSQIDPYLKKPINNVDDINQYGINKFQFPLLNTLYNILNISTLYLYNSLDKENNTKQIYKQISKREKEIKTDSPEIIFIHNIQSKDIENKTFKSSSNITEISLSSFNDVDFINNSNFTYNGNNYKLDYVLYMTNPNDSCTANGCGHCISGIHYDGEQYYYDSKYSEKNIKCREGTVNVDIKIPCSLIRQDWNNSINKEYFTINKCFLRNNDIDKKGVVIEKDILSDEKMFFSKNISLIRAYIKVDASSDETTRGGNNNKYKSTHKKVNIMNKNKNINERIIYINDIKNKFIKYNKTFKPLSDFKYNKKNKYYYI